MNNEPFQNEQGQVRRLLARLPDAPLPSNFTARVLEAVDREGRRPSGAPVWRWNWRFFFPRAVGIAGITVMAAVVFHQHELSVQRLQMARSAVLVASQTVPSVDALKNFAAIQRMGETARPDEDLLALASDMK